MTGSIEITSNEIGVVRIFAIDLPEADVPGLTEQVYGPGDDDYRWPLKDALGATYLDHDFVEVIRLKDLAGVGLSGYLTEGIGLPAALLEGDRAKLDGLQGHILIVLSQAFDGVAQTLTPKPPLKLIETYREPTAAPSYDPIHAEAAKGRIESGADKSAPSTGRQAAAGPIALAAVVLAALVVLWLTVGRS